MELKGKKVLVLGLGETGLSCVRWLHREGALVSAADSRPNPPFLDPIRQEFPDVPVEAGPFRPELLNAAELLVISPGVPVRDPAVADAISRGIPYAGDVELFALRMLRPDAKRVKVIGITGANGKSTVTTMVGEMCARAGLKTMVAGNIGLPVLDAITEAESSGMPDIFVLELSSFQLETTHSLHCAAAAVLNVTEDHMDRYDGMEDYAAAKARIFEGNGVQVLNREDAWSLGMKQAGRKVVSFGLNPPPSAEDWGLVEDAGVAWLCQGPAKIMSLQDLPLAGRHNAANALASLALCRATDLPLAPLVDALKHFKGLPHRVERVAEIARVAYFDDSKGTNVGATVAALNGMEEKVVLIAGGDGKGQDFTPLRDAVAGHARAVVLIGRDGPVIGEALQSTGVPLLNAATMEEAVRIASKNAQPGDAVLLSPACASFDMFRNYEHRAQVFIAAVKALEKETVR